MKPSVTAASPSLVRIWIQAFRPFSYTAAVVPVVLGAALAVFYGQAGRWELLPLIVVASVLLQAGTNLVSEYYDYRKGVDRPETYGSSRVLVDKLLRPESVLRMGLGCFTLCATIGLVFIAVRGWPILALGLVGILGGLLYTAGPLGYKYLGLGDLFVFLLMGPLMVVGSYFVLTGLYDRPIMMISFPVGFLVAGILSGNNLRDVRDDTKAGILTTASSMGHWLARWEYSSLIVGAYLSTAILIVTRILPTWSWLTMITLPLGVKLVRAALNSRMEQPETIATLDVETAKVHLVFGILLIVSVFLGSAF